MRRVRRIISITILLALMLAPAQGAFAGEEPIHSGTIVTAHVALAGGEPGSCAAAPDCRTWLQSGCDPALTGRDIALQASIEDVSGIADGRTPWLFELHAGCCRNEVMIQLWRPDCTEIRSRRWSSPDCVIDGLEDHCQLISVPIPQSARWMTVTANNSGYIPWPGELVEPTTVNWSLSQPGAPRVVDFSLRGHLWGVGKVLAEDPSCSAEVSVALQEKNEHGWFEMGTTNTDPDGEFEFWLSDRAARYRAIALPVSTFERTCVGSVSPIVQHRH